jgi:hypothetical protein
MMKLKTLLETSPIVARFKTWCEININQKTFTTKEPKFVKYIKRCPIETLTSKHLSSFQRALQFIRLKNIGKKIKNFGYIKIPLVVDESYKIIDGGHRLVVAWVLGFTHIPVIVYQFNNVQEKSIFFNEINTPEGGPMAAMERIAARKISKYPYETLIMKLISEDTGSRFYDQVGYKNHTGKDRITMLSFLKIINWIGLGIRHKWQNGDTDAFLQSSTQRMIKDGMYVDIRNRMNDFASWFFSWAGTKRSTTPEAHGDKNLYGMLEFYLMMVHQKSGRELKKTLKASTRKFTGYDLKNLKSYEITHVSGQLIKDFNRGKLRENRLVPIPFEDRRVPMVWDKIEDPK